MSADAPWWTSGLVGSALGVAALVVVGTATAQVAVPLLEQPAAERPAAALVDDVEPAAAPAYPRSASYEPPAPAESASAAPAPAAPSSSAPAAPAPAAPVAAAPSVAPVTTAAQARKSARKAERRAQLRRERRAARELAALARETMKDWGPVSATWVLPVASYRRLSSHYGETGPHWESIHTGQDFSAPTGTDVRAATAGIVTFAGRQGPYGNKVEITHPDGTVTWYAHLSRIDVTATDAVTTGQVVGLVGSTGNSTGPHLHFEVHPGGGDAVDPVAVLKEHGVSL